MCGKFTGKKVCVGAGDDKMHLLPQKTVGEQEPFGDVLHLVDEQNVEFAVNLVKCYKKLVQVFAFQRGQPFVVEVDIGKWQS